MGLGHQSYGIERSVHTREGVTYRLSFDYAGRLGYGVDFTRIAVYVDGVQIGSYANTSPNASLAWQQLNFEFTGNGLARTIQIRSIATAGQSNGRGAMLDDIILTEVLALNTGYESSSIQISAIVSALADADGSESLTVTVGAIPVGATLTDGTNSFTAVAGSTTTAVTAWDLDNLSITPPTSFTGTFDLVVSTTASEAVTADSAGQSRLLTVTVLPQEVSSPLVLDLNGDGVQTVSLEDSTGSFDLLNTGEAIRSGWISSDDAFLAVDLNGNGVIDDRSELFGGAIGDGFAKLATFDGNLDGKVDAGDARFSELLLWRDINENHQTDSGELAKLADYGVASLSTRYVLAPQTQNGNWLLEHGTATFTDGRSVDLVDAYFRIEAVDATAAVRPVERGATITVRSELPSAPAAASAVFLGGAVIDRPVGPVGSGPLIDWSASGRDKLDYVEDMSEEARKKKSSVKGWLADFLGFKSAQSGKDLAQQTGLKVVLDAKSDANRPR